VIRLGPLAKALLSQITAMALVLGLMALGIFGHPPALAVAVAAQAFFAPIIAQFLRSDRWWLWIHGLFPIAVAAANRLQIHSGWYLAAFLLFVLVFGPTVRSRVPLFLSNEKTIQAISEFLSVEVFAQVPQARVLDFGSGTGGMPIGLAKRHPGQQFDGIEAAWLPYIRSRLQAAGISNVHLMRGNFWDLDLSPYAVVYAFLSTEPMPKLWQKACREMQSGTILISNSFRVPDVAPSQVLQVDDERQTELLVYRIPPA
jgi:SAM-dependent methyltransferase